MIDKCPEISLSPKPKDIQFIIIYDEEKQQNLSFEKLKTENFWLLVSN